MTDSAALTQEEKIAQLWGRLDQAESSSASQQYLIQKKDQQIRDLRAQVDGLALQNHGLREQVNQAVAELNQARIAASTAVRDYIAQKG